MEYKITDVSVAIVLHELHCSKFVVKFYAFLSKEKISYQFRKLITLKLVKIKISEYKYKLKLKSISSYLIIQN